MERKLVDLAAIIYNSIKRCINDKTKRALAFPHLITELLLAAKVPITDDEDQQQPRQPIKYHKMHAKSSRSSESLTGDYPSLAVHHLVSLFPSRVFASSPSNLLLSAYPLHISAYASSDLHHCSAYVLPIIHSWRNRARSVKSCNWVASVVPLLFIFISHAIDDVTSPVTVFSLLSSPLTSYFVCSDSTFKRKEKGIQVPSDSPELPTAPTPKKSKFDSFKFKYQALSDRFNTSIAPKDFHGDRFFEIPKDKAAFKNLEQRQWSQFLQQLDPYLPILVREFYANVASYKEGHYWVRHHEVVVNPAIIRAH
ncbi:uncharacterized protein LOC129302760 [Prosopis cineraria]|uniref:uncharacterized protein LOC129302760 n=1 Tax=Prosopis cineraria TaxID=364024 RepID=UPI00240F3255|nr:uncharacterized protein LOC129302760 [Prosopis cineraria]